MAESRFGMFKCLFSKSFKFSPQISARTRGPNSFPSQKQLPTLANRWEFDGTFYFLHQGFEFIVNLSLHLNHKKEILCTVSMLETHRVKTWQVSTPKKPVHWCHIPNITFASLPGVVNKVVALILKHSRKACNVEKLKLRGLKARSLSYTSFYKS